MLGTRCSETSKLVNLLSEQKHCVIGYHKGNNSCSLNPRPRWWLTGVSLELRFVVHCGELGVQNLQSDHLDSNSALLVPMGSRKLFNLCLSFLVCRMEMMILIEASNDYFEFKMNYYVSLRWSLIISYY